MRDFGRPAVLALAAALCAGVAHAQTLPPAPYQLRAGATYAAPQSIDRYGGGGRRPAAPPATQGPAPAAAPGHYLAWAGKTDLAAPTTQTQPQGGWSAMGQRWAPATQQTASEQPIQPPLTPPSNPWRPLYPQQARAGTAPSSIYDAPPAPAAARAASMPAPARSQAPYPPSALPQPPAYRQASAQTNSGGPRFYSLHRDYGIQPDAIPLPPKFFGPTADLSAPVTDPLARRTTIVNGQAHTVAVPDDQGGQ